MAKKEGIRFEFEDGTSLEAGFKETADALLNATAGGIVRTMERISILIEDKYTIRTANVGEAKTIPVHPRFWTTRTGRAIRAYKKFVNFNNARLAGSPKTKAVSRAAVGSFRSLNRGMGSNEGIREIHIRPNKVWGVIGSKVPYAAFLEFGTSKMTARPALFPATDEGAKVMGVLIAEMYGKSLNLLGWRGR